MSDSIETTDKRDLKLFHVTETRLSWTLIAAESSARAREIAEELDAEAFQHAPTYGVHQIELSDEIPANWRESLPWGDQETDENGSPLELTCEQIVAQKVPPPPPSASEQHGIDQLLHGASVFAVP